MEEEKLLLTVTDVMKLTGLGRDRVYDIMHSNQFPVMKFGRRLMVHKDVFNNWLMDEKKNEFYYKVRTR